MGDCGADNVDADDEKCATMETNAVGSSSADQGHGRRRRRHRRQVRPQQGQQEATGQLGERGIVVDVPGEDLLQGSSSLQVLLYLSSGSCFQVHCTTYVHSVHTYEYRDNKTPT